MLRRPQEASYKLLSVLLQYPTDEVWEARDALAEEVFKCPSRERRWLEPFMAHWAATPLIDVQKEYVATFDLQRRCSLFLTYFTEGDTRRRGQALLRLKWLYRAAGLVLDDGELPDYLPVVLEFAALAPPGVGREILAEHRIGLELLWQRLRELDSPYSSLVQDLRSVLPALVAQQLKRMRRLAVEGPPTEEVGLQPFAPPEVMPTMEARP